jgi:hypothetical protein
VPEPLARLYYQPVPSKDCNRLTILHVLEDSLGLRVDSRFRICDFSRIELGLVIRIVLVDLDIDLTRQLTFPTP